MMLTLGYGGVKKRKVVVQEERMMKYTLCTKLSYCYKIQFGNLS